jgi:hypothetical protein
MFLINIKLFKNFYNSLENTYFIMFSRTKVSWTFLFQVPFFFTAAAVGLWLRF